MFVSASFRPLLLPSGAPPFSFAYNMGLFFAVSWVPDDGHARSLRSHRIAWFLPFLAPCFAACSSLLPWPWWRSVTRSRWSLGPLWPFRLRWSVAR